MSKKLGLVRAEWSSSYDNFASLRKGLRLRKTHECEAANSNANDDPGQPGRLVGACSHCNSAAYEILPLEREKPTFKGSRTHPVVTLIAWRRHGQSAISHTSHESLGFCTLDAINALLKFPVGRLFPVIALGPWPGEHFGLDSGVILLEFSNPRTVEIDRSLLRQPRHYSPLFHCPILSFGKEAAARFSRYTPAFSRRLVHYCPP